MAAFRLRLHCSRSFTPPRYRDRMSWEDTAGETAGLVTTFAVETDIGTTSCRTLVVSEAATSKVDLLFNRSKHPLALEVVSHQRDFPEPGWDRGYRLRRGLDIHRRIGDSGHEA